MYPISLKYWLDPSSIIIPPLYLVGGTVRDLLLGDQPKDIDLVCRNAKDFACRLGGRRNAAVVLMEKKPDEPCYRVVDREHPDNFLDIAEMRGLTIFDDLSRRDFTINAMAAEIREDGTAGPLLDPSTGAADLEQKTIKMTGPGSLVSDPLRILRAVRFSAGLGFTVDLQTREEMRRRAPLLRGVSGERIMTELLLILQTPQSSSFVREMDQLGILDVLFPEIVPMKGCAQNGFHHKDVWEHSLLVAENCEEVLYNLTSHFGGWDGEIVSNLAVNSRLPLLKLSALLHDIGKPQTGGMSPETGRRTFYGHHKAGALIVTALAGRMSMSCRDRDLLILLVSEHLHVLSLSVHNVKASTRMKWFRKMKENVIPAIILGMADIKSSLGSESTVKWRNHFLEWSRNTVGTYYETIRTRLASQNLVTGRDLIALGMAPGPDMGRLLDMLRNAQDTGEISTRDDALALAKDLLAKI
jgi:poly(A) polymerase